MLTMNHSVLTLDGAAIGEISAIPSYDCGETTAVNYYDYRSGEDRTFVTAEAFHAWIADRNMETAVEAFTAALVW